jgi:probable phosphoglycerate mutase
MPTIMLFRHGETQWNRAHRIQGQTDALSPLTLKGTIQAKAYGRALARDLGADIPQWTIIGSPLARCVQTLSILCDEADLDFNQIRFDDRLKEVSCGLYSGKLRTEVEAVDPDLFKGKGENSWYFRCPEGERLQDLEVRLGDWLSGFKPGDKAIVVTHGVAGKVIRGLYSGEPMAQALSVDSPQDAYFVLSQGKVARRSCGME